MKQWLAKLQLYNESMNLILRPFDHQEVEYAEAISIVYFVRIRIGSQRVRHANGVRTGKNGWW
jgi:hypothetical protein